MEQALSQLRDIHLPEPVSWWPPAPGWWLLALLLLGLLLLGGWAWRRRRARRALLREALAELAAIRERYGADPDERRLAAELSRLLRRVAISRFPAEAVAGLTGEAWLTFLDEQLGGRAFREGPGRWLVEAPYRSQAPDFDPEPLLALVQRWIEHTGEAAHA